MNYTYLKQNVTLLRNIIDQCIIDLLAQSASRPIHLPELGIIDIRLTEFVRLHHSDLLRTIRYEKYNLENIIHERYLLYQISSYIWNERQV